jgi:hypothetical protein
MNEISPSGYAGRLFPLLVPILSQLFLSLMGRNLLSLSLSS